MGLDLDLGDLDINDKNHIATRQYVYDVVGKVSLADDTNRCATKQFAEDNKADLSTNEQILLPNRLIRKSYITSGSGGLIKPNPVESTFSFILDISNVLPNGWKSNVMYSLYKNSLIELTGNETCFNVAIGDTAFMLTVNNGMLGCNDGNASIGTTVYIMQYSNRLVLTNTVLGSFTVPSSSTTVYLS